MSQPEKLPATYVSDSYVQELVQRVEALQREIQEAKAEIEDRGLEIDHWKKEAESYKPAWDAMKAENERLKAPVSRHNDSDGILQRFFITGGRQYRYVKEDAADLEKLINEWIASRATQPAPQEGK